MAIPIDDFVAATQRAKMQLSSFDLVVEEFKKTGNWMGEKYSFAFNPKAQPRNIMAEEISSLEPDLKARFTEEGLTGKRQQLETDIVSAGFREERKRMRIAQNVTDVEDFTQEEWDRLAAKTKEMAKVYDADVSAGSISAAAKNYQDLFKQHNIQIPGRNDNLQYLIHNGAPELHGGMLDPGFTKGDVGSSQASSNTKKINAHVVKDKLMYSDEAKSENDFVLKMIDEEQANFMSATRPSSRSS